MRRKPAKTVLHVLGERSWEPQFRFLGSTKDILGRRQYFAERGIECRELAVKSRDDDLCLKLLSGMDLDGVDAVLMEHPRYPKSLAWLKQTRPDIVRMIRGHNAELIHQLHVTQAYRICGVGTEAWRAHRISKSLKNARSRLEFDYACARLSDHVLAISDWEARWYWPFVGGLGKVLTSPYFLPDDCVVTPLPESERARRCICLMSADWSPLAQHAAKALIDLVKRTPPSLLDGWEFMVTGDLPPDGGAEIFDSGGRVRITGRLENPFDVMVQSRALAHLSNLGMGFKTKLLDFVQCGGWVLLPRRLYGRQPRELRPFCIVVDPSSPESLARALKKAATPWPDAGDVNGSLRRRAYRALDNAFGYA